MTSQTLDPHLETMKFLRTKGRLSNWMGLVGGQMIQRLSADQVRNVEADSAHSRQVLYGESGGKSEGDGVAGHTYLGDVTTPAPIVVASGGGSSLGPLLAAALGMLGPLGGVAGYFINQAMSQKPQPTIVNPPAQQTTTINQEDLTVRLLRPEDLRP